MSWPWNELGLGGPAGLSEIRKAYAQRLKTAHPEEDPAGFQRLHTAYQEASRQARRAARSAGETSLRPPPGPEAGNQGKDGRPLEEPESPEPPPEQPEASEWDYGALLEETSEPAGPFRKTGEPPPPEWDFERLLAQGEEEAQETRRRKMEDLRHKNWARYVPQARQRREADEEEAWPAVLAAVRALELLERSEAPPSQWRQFLDSSLFLSVRADMDFVFLLEDFLRRHPDLSPEIRRGIFTAYEAQNASKYPAYKPLYRLLGVARKDKRQAARAKSAWRAAWRSYPPWRKTVIVLCAVILAIFFSIGWAVNLHAAYGDFTARREAKRWEELAPQWLEEDYGEPFLHAGSDGVFAPAAAPDLYFRASPYGERTEHWPGYQTNYPHILVKQALERFAEEQGLDLDLAAYSRETGDAPGAYLVSLPLLGAEEDVTALGELLEELSRQDWHQVPLTNPQGDAEYLVREPAEYTVYLCHRGLAFYEAPSKEGFDTEEALDLYAQAGPAFCRWILEQSGLADEHLGAGTYVFQDRETLELEDGIYFQVSGADPESGAERVRYLLSSSGSTLFCLPSEKARRIPSSVFLHRGTIRHYQIDKVGVVIVMDQTAPG